MPKKHPKGPMDFLDDLQMLVEALIKSSNGPKSEAISVMSFTSQ